MPYTAKKYEGGSTASAPRAGLTKGKLGNGTVGWKDFLYNPSEFTDNISVEYGEIKSPGLPYPILTYNGGNTRSIQLDLYLNGREYGRGDEYGANQIMGWLQHLNSFIPPAGGRQFEPPQVLEFAFGWFYKQCMLETMTPRYTLFTPDLKPLEATISLTLKVIQMG